MADHVELGVGQQSMQLSHDRHGNEGTAVGMEQQHRTADFLEAGRQIRANEHAQCVQDRLARPLFLLLGEPGEGRVRKLLLSPILLWLGLVSYGFYLWSPAILEKLATADWSGATRTIGTIAIGLVGTAAVAAASWYLMERHAIALGRKLARRAERRRLEPAEAAPVSELAP